MPDLHPSYPAHLQEQGVVPVGLPVNVGEVQDDAARTLLASFQSLGDDCEFGLVQRRYGAEHLALLRWVTLTPATLTSLLQAGLAGLGDPATTEIYTAPWGELMAHDQRYDIRMHSFVQAGKIDLQRFKLNHCRRMDFLRTKLLEDLALGERLFVFNGGEALTDSVATDLQDSLRLHGPARLLAVSLPGQHPAGTVRALPRGLLRGHLARRGKTSTPGGHRWDIDFPGWLALCGTARFIAALG